jgi:L-fuculose-phosphate aldolase
MSAAPDKMAPDSTAQDSTAQDSTALRRDLIAAARRLVSTGLTRNTTGNISRRVEGGFLVTPTGMVYDALEPADIVFVDQDGAAHGRRLPSSEWRMHFDILAARPEIAVVLHAHSPFCTSLACLGRGIPAFHYMVAVLGGADIRCAPYATFGTAALSRLAVTALQDRKGCLLANHGMVTVAPDFDEAFRLGIELETLAEMYWRALQIGEPTLLDAEEMARVVDKFRTYGKQPPLLTD